MRSDSIFVPTRLKLKSFDARSIPISKKGILNRKIRDGKKKICSGMTEYFHVSTLHGLRYLVEPNRPKAEKYSWGILVLTSAIVTIWMACYLYADFLDAPTATSQMPTRKPVTTVPFPSIGLCNGNRLSKKGLTKLATELFKLQASTYDKLYKTVEEVYDSLLYMGSLYNIWGDDLNFNKLDLLHSFFSEVYNGTYSLSTILNGLHPPCHSTIRNCKWQGIDIDCRKIFSERRTHIGLCCLFNYQRLKAEVVNALHKNGSAIPDVQPIFIHGPGVEMGLSVLIDNIIEDYAYFFNSNLATYVYISEPLDYPDQNSGAITERILSPGQELFLSLHPQPVLGMDSMRNIPDYSRGCIFPNEASLKSYNRFYTFIECNLACHIDDMLKSCQCLPFNMPIVNNTSECLLSDILCLRNWHDKWGNVETENINNRKKSVSYQCQQCLPTCSYIRYKIQASYAYIRSKINSTNRQRLNLTRATSVLHVYFGDAYVTEYQQTIVYTWNDFLSIFGGLFSIMMGISIISGIEYLYFQTGRWFTIFMDKKNQKIEEHSEQNNIIIIENDELEKDLEKIRNLYWNEIKLNNLKEKIIQNNDEMININNTNAMK